jgi:hypothetical protein
MTSSATRRPVWAKLANHAFVLAIDAQVTGLGFEFDRDDPGFLAWTRPMYSKARFFVRLLEQKCSRKGGLQFGVQLGVASSYLMEVENEVKSWECGAGHFSPDAFPYREPIAAVMISLHWLLLNANPPVKTRLSWDATPETAEAGARQLRDDVEHYGLPFLRQVDTPDKLIDLLKNIENYPRKLREPGPRSSDSGAYAALLLHQLGRSDEAIEELEISRRQRIADYTRSLELPPKLREANIIMYSCKIDRFRQYIIATSCSSPRTAHTRP